MRKPVSRGGVAVEPGSVGFASIPAAVLSDGTAVGIPIVIVNGSEDGPTMWIDAVMHGPEIAGFEVVRMLTREALDPKRLRGAVIAAPMLNPLAFQASRMHTPQDEYNLNRLFPGAANGLLGQRMADAILHHGVGDAEYLVDLHANPEPAIAFSLYLAGDTPSHDRAKRMAKAFGVTAIEMRFKHEGHRLGTLSEAAHQLGKAAIAVELIGWRRILDVSVRIGVRGVLNILKDVGIISGVIEPQNDTTVIPGELTRLEVTADKGGIVDFRCVAGEAVRTNQVIAVLRNPYGDVVEEIRSPTDGHILAFPLMHNQAATTGDFVAFIALRAS